MGKNNPLRSMTPKNKNQKLYKAKKQWITACATFMLAFGATAVVNASVQADTTTPATTQAGGIVAESAQPQSSVTESAQQSGETKNTTDTSKTSEQRITTAQATEKSSPASSVNKTNSRVPNYKWDATAAPSLFNTNLVHKTQDVTDTDPAAQETRTVTVNYVKAKVNEDGTYTEAGNAFTSAVLDVYYTRQATKDLVTGTVTYGPWQWNTKKGDSNTPGYHVVSGTWTNLPQEWATVTADVPTLDGYTAYTGGPATNTNKVPANQFVFPTWNGSDGDTSDISKGSTAYTTAAPLYP